MRRPKRELRIWECGLQIAEFPILGLGFSNPERMRKMEMDKTRGVLLNVAHYLLTIISFVLWVLCAFLIRVTYMTIFRATVESTFRNTWMVSLIDKFLVIFLAIGIISSVIIVEGRYRKGIYDGSLWGKFFSVTSIQAILLFICQAILTFIFG